MSGQASSRPIKPRTRGPVELVIEVFFGLFFVSLFAWFVGLAIEVAGSFTIWKGEGIAHSQSLVEQDLGYIAAAPRSLLVDDTDAFARRLAGYIAMPFERLGVRRYYEAQLAQGAAQPAPVQSQKAGAGGQNPLQGGLRKATQEAMREGAKWALIAMHVAQDIALRLSVAVFALPAFLLACIVGAVDGLVRRDLRRWRGGRESSFVYHHAKRYTGWALTGGFGLYLTWPFGGFNPAYMVLVFTVLVAVALSTTVASFKKYV
ncbi:MAG: TIGR03747 family integrating conjugative element membrane protein [Pseudoxanthomonas sp.]|jgi:integrating conjugative element membrane protein (TIGR03747 family)|nr:TIGR03747 family integrating conjugative element membrane protein [Pseudoxanthomonas sp.]HRL52875.1 TIGR03747 family integrating conjugative element membrane protein [Acidovorax temperans]